MKILTIGQGEIGAPLTKLFKQAGHTVYAKDVEPLEITDKVDIMVISIPFKTKLSFAQIVARYMKDYAPKFVVINSTVLPGTCEFIQGLLLTSSDSEALSKTVGIPIVHSPIMGRHRKHAPEMMFEDISAYPKFIGADTDEAYKQAEALFTSIGLRSVRMSSTQTSELAKLLETTYSGILIGWAQESERICKEYGVDRSETLKMIEYANQRIEFKRPTDIFPGFIGGHCIMPNIELLLQEIDSEYLTAVKNSNERKANEVKGS